MKHFIFICILSISFACLAQEKSKKRGSDQTPKELRTKYYKYGKKEKEPGGWFSAYTGQMSGFVVLNSGDRLEGRTDGDLGLAKTDVAADESIHGLRGLHVGLHITDGL